MTVINRFNVIQTFFVDAAAVEQAAAVKLTSVNLYVKAKPDRARNSSGISKPGISVTICEVENEIPVLNKEFSSVARREYDDIYSMSDASVPTTFTFPGGIIVPTGRYYGIVVAFDDDDFALWTNKIGDKLIGTNNPSPGSTQSRDGLLFYPTNTATPVAVSDEDLKFTVKVAKYTTTTTDIDLVNRDYEFLTMTTRDGTFFGGETVFSNTAALAGTVAVTQGNTAVAGTGTTFTNLTVGRPVVVTSGSRYFVANVANITNTTSMTLASPSPITNASATFAHGLIAKLVSADYIGETAILCDSTANTSLKFAAGQKLRGETSNTTFVIGAVNNLAVDQFVSQITAIGAPGSTATFRYNLAFLNTSSNAYTIDDTYQPLPSNTTVNVGTTPRAIISRSNEVSQSLLYANAGYKSAIVKTSFVSNNAFVSPTVTEYDTDIFVRRYSVSNTYLGTYANSVVYDTEVFNDGIALSKHFTKKIVFSTDRRAEDLRVFCTAHRPPGTDIRVYAKLHNDEDNDPFDDKLWTPLEIKAQANTFSSKVDRSDLVEYEYGLPNAPEVQATISGVFTVTDDSNVISYTGSATLSSVVAAGKLIRIRSPQFAENYMVAYVSNVNGSNIHLTQAVTNNNIVGTGMEVDVLKYTSTAFNNPDNDRISRYFTPTGGAFDEYTTAQLKIVLLADETHIIPSVDNIQAIAVSA